MDIQKNENRVCTTEFEQKTLALCDMYVRMLLFTSAGHVFKLFEEFERWGVEVWHV